MVDTSMYLLPLDCSCKTKKIIKKTVIIMVYCIQVVDRERHEIVMLAVTLFMCYKCPLCNMALL